MRRLKSGENTLEQDDQIHKVGEARMSTVSTGAPGGLYIWNFTGEAGRGEQWRQDPVTEGCA